MLQAHVHHYTQTDGMDVQDFQQSLESLNYLIAEYSTLDKQKGAAQDSVPRLQVVT
jgi:tubulin epsilon